MLEQQHQEMQQWYKEEQKLQVCLEEVAKAHCLEQAAQKARKAAEAKVWKVL